MFKLLYIQELFVLLPIALQCTSVLLSPCCRWGLRPRERALPQATLAEVRFGLGMSWFAAQSLSYNATPAVKEKIISPSPPPHKMTGLLTLMHLYMQICQLPPWVCSPWIIHFKETKLFVAGESGVLGLQWKGRKNWNQHTHTQSLGHYHFAFQKHVFTAKSIHRFKYPGVLSQNSSLDL